MRSVSSFEARLLRILHAALAERELAPSLPLGGQGAAQPPCLSRDAVELAKDALAKGAMARLARGGWRQERFLRGEALLAGRLWQRRPPEELGLDFSPHALDFLIWLTAAHAEEASRGWRPSRPTPLASGDRLLLVWTYQAVRLTEIGDAWSRRELFAKDGLCRLLFAEDFADHPGAPKPDFSFWLRDEASWVLEALQSSLADRWTQIERSKSLILSPERMLRLGRSQQQTLAALFESAEQSGRRDLCRFLLVAAGRLLADRPTLQRWTAGLRTEGLRLAERHEVFRAAATFLRCLEQLQRWRRQATGVGYLDEGYAAAQLLKDDWERLDADRLCAAAHEIVRQADPLSAGQSSS